MPSQLSSALRRLKVWDWWPLRVEHSTYAVEAERDRLRRENEALKLSWGIDANHRDDLFMAIEKAYRQLSNTTPGKREKWVNQALTTLAEVLSPASDEHEATTCE